MVVFNLQHNDNIKGEISVGFQGVRKIMHFATLKCFYFFKTLVTMRKQIIRLIRIRAAPPPSHLILIQLISVTWHTFNSRSSISCFLPFLSVCYAWAHPDLSHFADHARTEHRPDLIRTQNTGNKTGQREEQGRTGKIQERTVKQAVLLVLVTPWQQWNVSIEENVKWWILNRAAAAGEIGMDILQIWYC